MSNPLSDPDTLNLNPDWPEDLTESEPSLDECRAELKSMFPQYHTDAWATDMQNQPAFVVRVRGAHFFGDRLSECMAKVRDWQSNGV